MLTDLSLWTRGASTTATQVDRLFFFLLAVTVSVGLLIAVFLIYFCIRYRRRPGETLIPPATKQSRLLEWFWTITPGAIFMVFFFWSGHVYLAAITPPAEATPVYVVAKQWMWKIQHPEGQREINTLHVPVGKPIKLLSISEDVIHSFFVPAFRIHMDVLPGRYNSIWFQATEPGEHHLFCSQYCGTDHARMIGRVVALEPAEYQRWLKLSAEGSLALRGRQVFLKYRCISCHSASHSASAPVLENLFDNLVRLSDGKTVRADRDYLRRSVLNPGEQIVAGFADIMPPFQGQISEDEMIALLAFFESLGPDETPTRVEHAPPPARTAPAKSEEPNP